MRPLTEPQKRLLERVRREGVVTMNGRARKTVQALAKHGLIEYEFDLVPHWNGRYTELFIVKPKG